MIYEQVKEIFKETRYNCSLFSMSVEYQEVMFHIGLFDKRTGSKIELKIKCDNIEELKGKIEDIIKLS